MLRNWLVANESSGSGSNSQGTSQTTDNNIASNDQSPPPNKKKKRNEESGFCPQTTEERIKNMKKRKEAGKWREFDHIEIEHTLITKDWKYGTHSYRELFLVPFGMAETMQKHHANKRNTVWNTLRPGVKDSLFLIEGSYSRDDMELTVSHMGNLGKKKFHHIRCPHCIRVVLPSIKKQYKFLPEASLIDVVSSWDKKKISTRLLDVAGCLIPLEKHVNAGPNARRFITRPESHDLHDKFHETELKEHSDKSQPPEAGNAVLSPDKEGTMVATKPPEETASVMKNVNDETVTVSLTIGKKTRESAKFVTVGELLDPKIGLSAQCKDKADVWSKEFMLKLMHTGVKKQVSNETNLETYDCVMEGIRDYHRVVLPDIKIDNRKLSAPPKVQIDRNNIHKPLRAILESFKEGPDILNPYNILFKQPSGKIFSLMHDGIQKFSRELNGVMVRTLSEEMDVITVPWKLTEIEGGSLNSDKLVDHLIRMIGSIHPLQCQSADQEVSRLLLVNHEADSFPKPPLFFHICKLLHMDTTTISLEMPFWPVAVTADGCSTNMAAGDKLLAMLGIPTPTMRCGSHAADGSLKRMANSKTMNVQEVSDFLPAFRKIMKHFKLSGKSTVALNVVLDIMGLKKVHMMTFCPTRMSYLLTASSHSVDLLVPICNVLVSLGVKKEQRDCFLSPKSMFVLHLLADLEVPFKKYFLRVLDGDSSIIIDTYRINIEFAERLNTIPFPALFKFLDQLEFDENGNLVAYIAVKDQIHDIILNFTHRPTRGVDRMQLLREEAECLKENLVKNLINNINDQNQSGSLVEFSSAFDLHRKIDLDQRIAYIEELADIYCTDYIQSVDIDDEFWSDYQISIKFPKKFN